MTDNLIKGINYRTDEIYVTGTRQVLTNVHTREMCHPSGRFCVIHRPSGHPLVNAPTHWRVRWENEPDGDFLVQVMERICPCGVFHPDIDDVIYIAETKGQDAGMRAAVHECCDKHCCREEP